MKNLEPLEELRLQNLKLLHGTVDSCGAPTSNGFSDYLLSKKIHIYRQELSNLYHRKKPIDLLMAQRIEKGLGLSEGWLSQDQSFWLSVSHKDILIMQAFAGLPVETKDHVAAIIRALSGTVVQP